jgi:hypothetical protein
MNMKRVAVIALAGMACVCKAQAQQPMDVTVIAGSCQPQSSVGGKPYSCDNAIFAFFDNQNSHVMIQFAKKGDDKAPILGFGGTMKQDGVTLDVDRIYLEPGKPQPAENALCKLSFRPPASAGAQPNITGIACSGQVPGRAQAPVAEVTFQPDPGQ